MFTAELIAIFWALKHLCPGESIVICTDSLNGLPALDQCFPKHPLAGSIQESVFSLVQSGCSVVFVWIPGHIGISDNKCMDQLANHVTSSPLEIGLPERELHQNILGLWYSE